MWLKTLLLAVTVNAGRDLAGLIAGPNVSRSADVIKYHAGEESMSLDWRVCSRARLARDARFDGKFFIGVLTTKIYCRPICRSRTSQESNVRYFPSAAAAAEAGFRPCLRCRPECAPGTPARAGTQNTVSRALRLIGEMGLEDGGVEGLAEHLGMGSRHLRRLFLHHLGATPSAVAHTRRLQFAKRLMDETALTMTQVAFAAGFGSVRRFNATIRSVYHRTPTQLRRLAQQMVRQSEGHYLFHLSFRPPYDWQSILKFLAAQATPGVEVVRDGYYRRSVLQQENRGYLEVSLDANHHALDVRVRFGDPRSLFAIIERVRVMFDLDADWATIAHTLASDPELASQVSSRPGLRVPGCWNGFEFAVLAVLGQEMDREAASALAGRMLTNFGVPYSPADGLSHLFPTPEVLALADMESIGVPRRQADATRALSCLVRDGQIRFERVADSDALIARLGDIPGIGRLAAQWIALRALRQPDAFPSADPVFARALDVATTCEVEERSEAWRPWRAYAAMYFWTKERISAREHVSTARGTEMPVNSSMVIDKIPSDIGMESAAIVKELVRNAHDAYRALEPRRLEEEKLERAVVMSRQRNGDNTGQFFIEDNGQGQSLKHVLRKLQTSVRRDLESFKAGSGPGGKLCSWPILSAGSMVIIESTMKGIADRFHLEINVRRICEEMDAASSVDDILRDSGCISVSREDFEKRGHGTMVVIECDGKTEIVNGYKLNCFYHLTDPKDETLSQFLVKGWSIPYSIREGVGKKVRDVYGRTCFIPTALYVDGSSLDLRLRAVSRTSRLSSCKPAKRDLQALGRPRYSPSPQGS